MAEQIKLGDRLFLKGDKIVLDVGNTGEGIIKSTSGTVKIEGNLWVEGTSTTVDTETVTFKDDHILIGYDSTGVTPQSDFEGIEAWRDGQTNAQFSWDEILDRWTIWGNDFHTDGTGYFGSIVAVNGYTGDVLSDNGVVFFSATGDGSIDARAGNINNTVIGDVTPAQATFTQLNAANTFVNGDLDVTGSFTTITTDGLNEGISNLYFTDERVDDRIDQLFNMSYGINSVYNDALNTYTVDLDLTNIGTGEEILVAPPVPGNPAEFRTITSGPFDSLTVTTNGDEIEIDTLVPISHIRHDNWIGDNTTGTYTLPYALDDEYQALVYIDGVVQEPIVSYTITGDQLVLSGGNLDMGARLNVVRLSSYSIGSTSYPDDIWVHDIVRVGRGEGDVTTNTVVGALTLNSNTTGARNTAIGSQSLYSNTTGSQNVASGFQALYSNTTGNNNVASGTNALYSNTTGNYNVASGTNALYSNTTGNYNVASGRNALYANTTGGHNVASGYQALFSNTTGINNVAFGYDSLRFNTTGYSNIAFGRESLYSNTTGVYNVAIGRSTLHSNTTGVDNVASGFQSLYSNTTGSYNVASGYQALNSNTTGSYNVASGYRSGNTITTGTNNTMVGNNAQPVSITADDQISIRAGATKWMSGTGSPEGLVFADIGSLYTDQAGTSGTVLYVKEANNSSTFGWIAHATVGAGPGPILGGSISPATITLTQGAPTSETFTAAGGTAPYAWSVQSGTLPVGMLLNPVSGVISGTPTTSGAYVFTIRATDANGDWIDQVYSGTVSGAIGLIWTAAGAVPNAGVACAGVGTASFVAGCTNGQIYRSTDNGASWSLVHTAGSPVFEFARNPVSGRMVIVGTDEALYSDDDGATWTTVVMPPQGFLSPQWLGVCYSGNQFVANGQSGNIAYSANGSTWTLGGAGHSQRAPITAINNVIVSGGNSGNIFRSNPPSNAGSIVSTPTADDLVHAASDGTIMLMVGEDGTILRSVNTGASWDLFYVGIFAWLQTVDHYDGVWLTTGVSGDILRSTDGGVSWIVVASSFTFTGDVDLSVGPAGAIAIKGDGNTLVA